MGEVEKHYAAVVFDANVIIAALVRERGFNRYIVSLTLSIPTYYVEALRDEIRDHIGEVAQKAGKSSDEIGLALHILLERVKPLPDEEVDKRLSEALGYVKDQDDSVYVATALYLRHEKGFE